MLFYRRWLHFRKAPGHFLTRKRYWGMKRFLPVLALVIMVGISFFAAISVPTAAADPTPRVTPVPSNDAFDPSASFPSGTTLAESVPAAVGWSP